MARITKGLDRAITATRIAGGAAGLAKGDEVGVPGLPVADGKDLAQSHFGVVGGLGGNEAEAVSDAMHVHIYADARLVKAQGDDKVGGLASHARQLAELFNRARQNASELFLKDMRQLFQMARLVSEETDGIDELLQFVLRNFLQIIRGPDMLEEASAGACCAGIFGARTQDGADKDTERIIRLRCDQFNDRRRSGFISLLQQLVDRRYV